METKIKIKGARTHNLKNIDLEIPRDKLVVITGLSGSGKSSLAFDTLYAEGQRRYVESLSSYARQFLGMIEKPDVDSVEGLSPAISIDQKTTSKNPRSTVGTITEIYDYLRLLFARIGEPFCPNCKVKINGQTVEQIVEAVSGRNDVLIAAPVIVRQKGEHLKVLENISADGFTRVIIDGELFKIEDVPVLDRYKNHDISIVIDRILKTKESGPRVTESVKLALLKGGGLVESFVFKKDKVSGQEIYSENMACSRCSYTLPELEPRLFSFNSPKGACEKCHGIGYVEKIDPNLLIPDPSLSINEGALSVFEKAIGRYDKKTFVAISRALKINPDTAWKKIAKTKRDQLLFGSQKKITIEYTNRFGRTRTHKNIVFKGVLPLLEEKYSQTDSDFKKERLGKYVAAQKCNSCHGARLSPDSLAVLIAGVNISALSEMPLDDFYNWFLKLKISPEERRIADLVLKEIENRTKFLLEVGLDYLTLSRGSATLSGGESQRIRLATQIGSRLVGVLYILDEPSIGLHPRDNDRLLDTLKDLRDLGNSVLVVEHDRETMLQSDWIIDLGPGAGEFGGEVVAAGTPKEVVKGKGKTALYLAEKEAVPFPQKRRDGEGSLRISGVKTHNLKNISADFKLKAFNCVTGVSGSGKSSLVLETLAPAVSNRLMKTRHRAGEYEKIQGLEHLTKIISIDQTPIGRTPRSNPATYIGLFDPIRTLFSQTKEAKKRGYKPGRFSFNVDGGRCETCRGDGEIKIEMHFLADVHITCQDCSGKRYNTETLEISYKGKTIADVLEMTVSEALPFFKNVSRVHRKLKTLNDVGLSYVRLGQPATTLSGGEAQRIKLASELSKTITKETLYVLDEPTTGLHFDDVVRLINVLNKLVDAGNTVIVIEHNLDVVKSADWVLDIGPEGGSKGGLLIGADTPEKIAMIKNSETGKFLKKELKNG